MTTREDFTDKEWKMLVFSPSFTANGIAASDGSISKKETLAITQSLLKANNQFSKKHLISLILTDLPDMIENQDFPGEMRYVKTIEETKRAFKKLAKIVDEKVTAKEAADYKQFIVGIADNVANASGSFLNLFGEDVTVDESEYCDVVREALGLPASPKQVENDNE